MTYRSMPPKSSSRWWVVVLVMVVLLVGLGLLGYVLTGGLDVLSYSHWQLLRAQRILLGHVKTLQGVHVDMVETMETSALSLAEANDRFVGMDQRLQQVAKAVQEMDIPPALAGHVRRMNDILVVFGESMTLLQQTLVDDDPAARAGLSSRLRGIESELDSLRQQLELEPKGDASANEEGRVCRRCVVFVPVVVASGMKR